MDFVRRNRGKIIAGTVLAGGAYLAQKFIRQYYEEQRQLAADRNLAAAATTAFGMDPQRMMLQNRRFYIFDSNQRTCDNSILQIVPSIKTKLQKRFDVETAVESLKHLSAEADNLAYKTETWNHMKTDAFARLFSASISYSILVLSLKVQISILAAQIYENSIQSTPNQKYESWFSKVWYSMGGNVVNVKPRTGAAKRKFDVSNYKNSSAVQQLFLQALQFFVNKGVDSLTDFIQPIVADHLSSHSLNESITLDQLKKLIQNLRSKLINSDSTGGRHFSFYVVPLCHTGTMPEEPILEELLILLKTVLESPDAQQLFDFGMDSFMEGAIKFVINSVNEYKQDPYRAEKSSNLGVPLARLVPVITDAFHEISRVNFDSALSNFIISQELNDFCIKVFNRDQSIW